MLSCCMQAFRTWYLKNTPFYKDFWWDADWLSHTASCLVLKQLFSTKAPFTQYNLLSNPLSSGFDNWLIVCIPVHDTTCCQTGLTSGCIVYTNIQPVVKPVWQPAVSCIQPVVKPVVQPSLTTGWTNSGCLFNPVEQTVDVCSTQFYWQPVWQPIGFLFTQYSQLSNRFHNRLYCVNGV